MSGSDDRTDHLFSAHVPGLIPPLFEAVGFQPPDPE